MPRLLTRLAGTAVLAAACSLTAFAHAAQPTRLVVAFPPGGPADTLARILARALEPGLDSQVIIENKPGANGAIAANQVIRAPDDGSMLFLSSAGAISINPSLYPNLSYAPSDLVPVGLAVHTPEVLVVAPTHAATTANQYLEEAKSRSTSPSIASSGVGSMPHMAIALLRQQSDTDFLHVAYRGAAPAISDTMGGHVEAFIGDISGLMPFITSKQLKALAVTAPERLSALPDVPTLDESGVKNVYASNWYGLFAPPGTAEAVVTKLNAALNQALQDEAVKKSLAELGVEPSPGTPQDFRELVAQDTQKWKDVIQKAGITAD